MMMALFFFFEFVRFYFASCICFMDCTILWLLSFEIENSISVYARLNSFHVTLSSILKIIPSVYGRYTFLLLGPLIQAMYFKGFCTML